MVLASLTSPHIFTANIIFKGLIAGLSFSLVAMGIVLIYRSSRIINFAVADLGVPATAVLAIFVVKHGWPYWAALIFALIVGTLSGTVVELFIIRRLFKAPRVIVLVATIGIAQLCRGIVQTGLSEYRTGKFQSQYPTPINGEWKIGDITVTGPQVLVLIVVPIVALFLWWLLGHTKFADAVRASATNADLARMTGISPKLISTAIWTIAGFLSTMSVILYATQQGSTELVQIGPDTLLAGLTAALIGGMRSFPRAAIGGIAIGIIRQVLFYNFFGPNQAGLTQFLLFILVLVLVSRMSRTDDSGGESFAFAPRVPPVPERLREIWWVRRMPQLLAAIAFVVAAVVPLFVNSSGKQQTYTTIFGFAICAISVTVLTGWAGQLSLGQMAFAGVGALSAAAFERGLTLNIGWKSNRLISGALRPVPLSLSIIAVIIAVAALGFLLDRRLAQGRSKALLIGIAVLCLGIAAVLLPIATDRSGTQHRMPFALAIIMGASVACLTAVAVGIGALRVKGLLLAISTLAFAIAAQSYIFPRPILDPDQINLVEFDRGKLGPIDLAFRNRAYYWFVLGVLILVLLLVGHLRRTGIGRMIIGVRENENGAAALTVSPTRAKLTAFALGGFVAGVGGALLGGLVVNIGYIQRFFRVEDSLAVVSMAVIGGLGSLAGAVTGALWVIGLPAFWPDNTSVPFFTSSIGLLIILLYMPGGFTQIGYWVRGEILKVVDRRLPERPTKTITTPPVSLRRVSTGAVELNADGSALSTTALSVHFGGIAAVNGVNLRADAGEVIGLIGTNGAGKSTLLNAIGGFVPSRGDVSLLGRDISSLPSHQRARVGLGRTFQAATLFPELTVRETVQLALEARRATSFWGSLLNPFYSIPIERQKRAEAAELIDFLGLGRYADRFVAELSTGTRRIVELASVLAVAPQVICLDEPTAGVAQREAEAFGPLIKRVQQELDATLIVVEHDLPLILSISDRIYCMESGEVICEGPPDVVRADPRVVASYLGTDERAIQRSNA
ncbi:MAG TPA: branched-chain amino acid ABC transporter permease/ATP-binding protein [Acidimicrobiia bacterium]|jgi:ABC-type branched-subunit amino acid transport system ATPase component/ABC-type branched-subunit amino acid transport system permease subunit|nr:branched-chain amino acid ABC transporter permease/ATP-binding protein [Acidimicrobiia bacterium]